MPIFALQLLLGSDLGRAALRLLLAIVAGGLLLATLTAQAVISTALLALVGVVPAPGLPDGGPGPPPAIPAPLAAHVAESERLTGVPASLLTAIAQVESGFNPRAVGPLIARFAGTEDAHALGLMQFLPSTYRGLAPRVDALIGVRLGQDGLWQPRQAILAAALFLQDHSAPGDVRRALYRYNNDGAYVDRVLALAARYAAAVPADGVAARALAFARTQLGVPYRWGGGTPGQGFDCSGLVQWAYAAVGHQLPRTAQQQFSATQRVSRASLAPGDLVFYWGTYTSETDWITHVALFDGDGVIMAPAEGQVVQFVPFDHPYWSRHLAGFGRLAGR